MTPDKQNDNDKRAVLEEILETVQSIDHNVEAILEHIGDHIEDQRYRHDWYAIDHDESRYTA